MLFVLLALLAATAPAARAAGFTLTNRTGEAILTFQIAPQGQTNWSRNWLSGPIRPGRFRTLTFSSSHHSCRIAHRIVMQSGATFIGSTDICTVTGLTVRHENGRYVVVVSHASSRRADIVLDNATGESVLSFQVAARGTGNFSRNWLSGALHPGMERNLNFRNARHDCRISHRIVMQSGATFTGETDVCRFHHLRIGRQNGRFVVTVTP